MGDGTPLGEQFDGLAWAKARKAAKDAAPVGSNRCPKCYAQPGTPCKTKTGGYSKRLHIGRGA